MKGLLLLCLLPLAAFALTPEQLPDSIPIAAGKTVLRLDKAKRWNINRIDYANHKMCLDSPGAHYGTVFSYADKEGFCGSGHVETGHAEEVRSITILQDGREVTAEELRNGPVMGRKIEFAKFAQMRDFSILYRFTLCNDVLEESVEVTADKDVRLHLMYHFMHPWRVEFTEMLALDANGKEVAYVFKGDGAFALKGKACPLVAWFDARGGRGVATRFLAGVNHHGVARMVWDRGIYRKDYFVDYRDCTFPKGTTAAYRVQTGFFQGKPETWKETVRRMQFR